MRTRRILISLSVVWNPSKCNSIDSEKSLILYPKSIRQREAQSDWKEVGDLGLVILWTILWRKDQPSSESQSDIDWIQKTYQEDISCPRKSRRGLMTTVSIYLYLSCTLSTQSHSHTYLIPYNLRFLSTYSANCKVSPGSPLTDMTRWFDNCFCLSWSPFIFTIDLAALQSDAMIVYPLPVIPNEHSIFSD